ncbi:MAG: site-specific integrase [Anaeromyxobacter sp.]
MGVKSYTQDGREFWAIDVWLQLPNGTSKRHRQKNIPTREHAEMLLAKLQIDAFEGRFFDRQLEAKTTVTDTWKAWEPITRRDNDSWQSDIDRARHLVRILGPRRAAKLSRKDIEEYRQQRFSETTRRGAPPAPGTVDREIALLKRCINYAIECGVLVRNPIAGVPLLNEPNTRDMALRESMLERILKAAPPAFAPVIEFDYETGLRKTEVRFLRWEQLDLAAGCIRLSAKETKTNQARVVYLTSRAKEILQQVPRHLHSPYVFLNPDTGRPWSELNKMLKRSVARAGLKGIWFHDLRRSFVTNARRRGVPESVVMKLTGHRTRSVFDRYNIIDEGDLKAAVEQIDRARREERHPSGLDRRA